MKAKTHNKNSATERSIQANKRKQTNNQFNNQNNPLQSSQNIDWLACRQTEGRTNQSDPHKTDHQSNLHKTDHQSKPHKTDQSAAKVFDYCQNTYSLLKGLPFRFFFFLLFLPFLFRLLPANKGSWFNQNHSKHINMDIYFISI